MTMTYTTLTAAKTTNGSIASWVNYSKLDVGTILDEAQSLLYGVLRVREMRTRYIFRMEIGDCFTALPSRFLDPIGRMYAPTLNLQFRYKDTDSVESARIYNPLTGTLGASPFTTTNGSSDVTVALTSHGFNQGSIFTSAGATAVGGLTINGTFQITDISTNSFVIDCTSLGEATSGATGGGSSVTYACDNLIQLSPSMWGIWDEQIQFDAAFVEAMSITLSYYQSLPLLSSTVATNFLTTRYPQLLRTACLAAAADFMKDDTEYQKHMGKLSTLVQAVNAENDMGWRAMELDTEVP